MAKKNLLARLMWGGASTLVMVGLSAGASIAQNTTNAGDNIELETIVVKGARPKAAEGEKSPLTTVTDRQEIQERMVESFEDLGRRVDAGVNFDTQNNSINLRGLDQNRVLTTIDGIRVPWLTDPRSNSGGLNAVDFDGLSAIDITKGADSSRYGSGALGGVVQLQTLDPEDLLTDGRNWGAITKGVYDSADRSWRTNAAVAARANDTEFLIQGGYRQGHEFENMGDVGGYGATRTEANPLDFDQGNFLAKIYQNVDGGHRFGITGEYFKRDADIDDKIGSTASYVRGSLESGDDVERKRISASYDYISPDKTGWIDEAHAIAYWQQQILTKTTDGVRLPDSRARIIRGDPFFYGYPSGIYTRDNELKQDSYGLTGNVLKSTEIGNLTHTFRVGGEIYRQDLHQYSAGVDNCPDVDWSTIPQPFGPQSCRMLHSNSSDMPDVESLAVGLYAEDDIDVLNGRVTITPGGRFDWYDHRPQSTAAYEAGPNFDGTIPSSNSDSRFSPKLRATWHAAPDLDFYAQWAQGFRAPTALELFQNYGAPGSYARIGNPDLKPETSNGFEIGAKLENETYGFGGSIFNNYYRNFIEEVTIAPPGGEFPVGGITGYANLDRVQIYGAELRGHVNFADHWRTWASVAWTVGKDTENDEYLNSVPPVRAIVGLGYAVEDWGSDVSLTMASRRDKVSDGGFVAPGYALVDTTLWWEPKFAKGMKLQAGIFNVFDTKYWNALDVPDSISPAIADRYTEVGRSFRVSLTQKF
ncbi:hemoglobin/transferrin/lactoferrin receptor protein [Phyllobacterium trifolii]|jgi:hemoglobin/transferrin/lactoferrin receptor protein|uniref:Hemoglobin/transferrin/lactoferrin receptor protein n=1 Tax=Phyllobacterium trifolii TaxID=300193 RepID=A0A839UEN4_9HYPH|nr:TonB-dependent hemoglobin/transferrin/lactoferrin family receptor [Phyllobacterium trifolii]MBB3147161.1 hemoglobin/transferrin/lactoferrin receptor protein [Phyllobacterium trifolii]